jgi:E3 ubiquitin-protein ligase RGLG
MGNRASHKSHHPSASVVETPEVKKPAYTFVVNPDQYHSLKDVQDALHKAGLESSNLIIGVDYTKSNEWTGKISCNGHCQHDILSDGLNPYQRVIGVMARTLEPFDDDHLIPAYGFGDATTTDKSIFPFYPDRPCNGVDEVLKRYNEITPSVVLSGPTSFEPIIRAAIDTVKRTKQYHILIIVCDGAVVNVNETTQAILDASNYPLSIVVIGVGDGPWEQMKKYDDGLPERKFDNFQFVQFHKTVEGRDVENGDIAFALAALMEIPDQYYAIRKLKLLENI